MEHRMTAARAPSLFIGMAISLATILLSLLGIEAVMRYSTPAPVDQWDHRLMFFSEGSVFNNLPWGGFVYQPRARIRSETYYITDVDIPRIVKEYSYEIRTNSSGLVQSADIDPSRPAIIFLGDSFTEGQGAPPWFYQLERRWPKTSRYQPINGGILGTGFESWERLYRDVATKTDVKKAVIIFISDDWYRAVWQITDRDLECIRSAARCTGSNFFFGLPANPAEAGVQIKRMAKERGDALAEQMSGLNAFKASAIYRSLLVPASRWWSHSDGAESEARFKASEDSLLALAARLGRRNLLLIHLPEKHELNGGPDSSGRRGREFIRRNGLPFADGFKECGLKMTDYHQRDGHPNSVGYDKIRRCIERLVGGG